MYTKYGEGGVSELGDLSPHDPGRFWHPICFPNSLINAVSSITIVSMVRNLKRKHIWVLDKYIFICTSILICKYLHVYDDNTVCIFHIDRFPHHHIYIVLMYHYFTSMAGKPWTTYQHMYIFIFTHYIKLYIHITAYQIIFISVW